MLVREAQIAFIRATAIERWAAEGGPIRRRQEIPEEDTITGRLPTGKIVSLSHCWDATCNCDPTGQKTAELAQALTRLDVGAERGSSEPAVIMSAELPAYSSASISRCYCSSIFYMSFLRRLMAI